MVFSFYNNIIMNYIIYISYNLYIYIYIYVYI